MRYVGKNGLKVGGNGVWHEGNFDPAGKAETIHNHTKNQITDFPSSLPANGGTSDILRIPDTRNVDDTPGDLQKRGFTGAFKLRANVGNPPVSSSGNYVFILTVAGYGGVADGSGGWPVQIAFGGQGIAYRQGNSTSEWGVWRKISNLEDIPTSLPANGGNADTVNGKTVDANVPANAKFTDTLTTINGKTGAIAKADIVALGIPAQDTVYTHPANHPASMITDMPTKLSQFQNDIGAGAGLNIVASATEPAGMNPGDWWYKEV